jgi:hypothetical protein
MSPLFFSVMGCFFPLTGVAVRVGVVLCSLVSRRDKGMIAFFSVGVEVDAKIESHFLVLPGFLLIAAGIATVATSSDAEESVAYAEEGAHAEIFVDVSSCM